MPLGVRTVPNTDQHLISSYILNTLLIKQGDSVLMTRQIFKLKYFELGFDKMYVMINLLYVN